METFETQSLYQGAWCLCAGLKLIGTKRDDRKVTLIFQGKDAEKRACEFFNGAKADVQMVFSHYRSLKDTVFLR